MDTGYHILRVQTGKDFETVERLVALGIETLSIVTRKEVLHHRSKRKIVKTRPLFAGYVFACVPASLWRAVRRTEGVIGPLRSEGGTGYPETVRREEVTRLQEAAELSVSLVDDTPPFKPGERVTFDLFSQKMEAIVKDVKGDVVEATAEISGKRVTVTRVAGQFGAAA